jgi:acetoin utilization deacetylase AcuC-like enzyme
MPRNIGACMTTILFNHPASLGHATPPGHPERPDRARALEKAFAADAFSALERRSPEPASLDTVALAHPRDWVDEVVAAAPTSGLVQFDSDTVMSPGTMDCVLRAVGAATAGVDAVVAGQAKNTFSAMRPPGHHAERTKAMGFCIFNFAAVAARYAQKAHGVERVAIVDWDVHHGNGSQDIFWSDPSVMYASTHQMPLYPGTGAVGERGDHDTIVNAPLRPGADGEAFRDAMESRIMPRLEQFRPDLLIISAGFDAHWRDPLASLRFEAEDFAWATKLLMGFADRTCGGRIVSVLEGGYDLQGLAESAAAHVTTLMEA